MSDLADARTQLAALLNTITNVRAVTVIPKTFTPPIVWVSAGSPYRTRAQPYGKKRIHLIAVCIGGMSTNDAAMDASDALAEKVANKIDSSTKFLLDPANEIEQPRLYSTAQGQDMLGIAVNVMCETTRA